MTKDAQGPESPGRRTFLTTVLRGAGALAVASSLGGIQACGDGNPERTPKNTGGAGAGPEIADLRFGIIALTDCAPIVIAHEKGFFRKHGIRSTIVKGASWAAIRDALSTGDIHASQMLFGMPIASTMGLLGAPKKPMIIPWILNRNGQGITLRTSLMGQVGSDPAELRPFVEAARDANERMTFAMTFPSGTHAMWLRYYLGAGGIHPDRDVSLITVPPPQMIANMKIGKMDGFCVGEPWNARAIADGIGFTSVSSQDLWKDHPEKVCAFTAEFAERNPKTVKAVLKALYEASVWLDTMANRPEACSIISTPAYINCPPEIILGRMQGRIEYGDGRVKDETEHYMTFFARNANYPQPKYATWFLTQFRRWGMVEGAPDYEGIVRTVMRPDIYEEAMIELGVTHGSRDDSGFSLFDGTPFDPTRPEDYAAAFAVHARKG